VKTTKVLLNTVVHSLDIYTIFKLFFTYVQEKKNNMVVSDNSNELFTCDGSLIISYCLSISH